MIAPTVLAALLAAVPSVLAQAVPDIPDVTSSFTRCTTRFGYQPLPTGTAGVPTWYAYTTTTHVAVLTYTTRDTVTSTPDATTFTNVATTTQVVTSITTSTPPATTIPTPAGFLPLVLFSMPEPTAVSRVKRLQLVDDVAKRQTPAGYTGGYIINPDGTTSSLNRVYPHRVLCQVRVTVNTTDIIVETAAPTTIVLPVSTDLVQSTSTVITTTTITEVVATPSVYAACAANNVVDHITDRDGNRMNFDRIAFRPAQGFPIENELVTNTVNAVNCCIACQNSPNCAGSFFVPSRQECHLRFTVAPVLNATSPLIPGGNVTLGNVVGPTGTAILPTGTSLTVQTQVPASCAKGSDTLYLGTIRGKSERDFPRRFALAFSNGPCGRMSVSPIRVRQ
ncbi:hypothetical protein BU24DRAFT_252429 [Aaosphaeria arxii CBS 175.79]|uniref:Apple domain-containing protein n=1 Tax=Aaosphaeria arxii CBS 175.79 TaxID=1450172 RepID=A0A6A5XHU8_9PLEO|nr:uncharacterized protein BU24DRAFT_252429 [Aaosphaeria arxii CBS 175.79]KAF2012436.1 hypothetical protein BU24DRAFT_252429 [Aaosphaeria arxii CBS 175.79]